MYGWVLSWATATRPEATWPDPSPLVSLNHGRCAGALAWVRTQTLCLPASELISFISSRALFGCPAGAGAFIVTAMTFSPADSATCLATNMAHGREYIPGRRLRPAHSCTGKFASGGFDPGRCRADQLKPVSESRAPPR